MPNEGAADVTNPIEIVDYNAWNRGYMPPSEHILIDKLAFRGAKVTAMSAVGGASWWLVVEGEMTRKQVAAMSKAVHMALSALEEIEWASEPEKAAEDLHKPESK
jgi:hypothetical protein